MSCHSSPLSIFDAGCDRLSDQPAGDHYQFFVFARGAVQSYPVKRLGRDTRERHTPEAVKAGKTGWCPPGCQTPL